jgi:opacity protein-like surface antigen
MKKLFHLLSALTMATLLASRVNAGETAPAPAPPPEIYGQGWYGAIHMGANIYQDRGDSRTFTNGLGDSLFVDPNNDTGFFGGVKIGYVFGTGSVRFALEEDMFYNGYTTGADFTLNLNGVTTQSDASVDINTGAFMTNGIFRFGTGQFQPYLGAGIGVYYGESSNVIVGGFSTGTSSSHADFAWNVIAGADYYFNPKMSMFIEYKYLQYTGLNNWGNDGELGQQLLGAGLRFHF